MRIAESCGWRVVESRRRQAACVRVWFRVQPLVRAVQRKVFTTPVRNEADDVSVTIIIPKVRGVNKERGCAAVSIGEKCYRSISTFMAK